MSVLSPYAPSRIAREETLLGEHEDEFFVGQLRRQVRLGSEAVYRVCGYDDYAVYVEVLRAPGLKSGLRFKFARDAVALMDTLEDGDVQLTRTEPQAPLAPGRPQRS